MSIKTKSLDYARVKQAYKVLKSIEKRMEILKLVSDNPSYTVAELQKKSGCEQAEMSQYLASLRDQDLITYEKEGKFHEYYLTDRAIEVCNIINKFAKL